MIVVISSVAKSVSKFEIYRAGKAEHTCCCYSTLYGELKMY